MGVSMSDALEMEKAKIEDEKLDDLAGCTRSIALSTLGNIHTKSPAYLTVMGWIKTL